MSSQPPSSAPHQRQIADLQTVLQVTRELAATFELTPLLRSIEQAALQVLRCERATVFLHDEATGQLYSRMATGVEGIRFSADRGIAGQVVRTGEIIVVVDAYADARFNPEIDRLTGFQTRNMIAFPLRGLDNAIVGVLQVLNKSTGEFSPWDKQLVETLGAQIGVVLQRQLLLEQYAQKQRMEADLDIARRIQQGLLPKKAPEVPGFDIAGWNKPADQTGGDCYDFFTLEDGTVAITIADATGHGIGPALVIAECRALFRAMIGMSQDLGQVVARVNSVLCDDLPADRFVTAFFGLLSPRDGVMRHLSAGHGPLLHYVRRSDEIVELRANSVPLGIMPEAQSDAPHETTFCPGDMMVLVTDGFHEWTRSDHQQFGINRLKDVVRRNRDRSSADIIQALQDAVLRFADGATQEDDLTAVIIKRCDA